MSAFDNEKGPQMEFYHDPDNRIGIMRPKGATVVITLPPEVAREVQRIVEQARFRTVLPISDAARSVSLGLRSVLQADDNTQRLDPAFAGPADEETFKAERAGTWAAPTPESMRALRKGEATEPGHALGSRGGQP